jgi:predicted nucleic acid-binding protein
MKEESCYRFELFTFQKGLLDDCIDATYIIHLENNGRLENIQSQLKEFYPSKKVYIVYNKGFRNCKKDTHINTPPLDLVDAFINVFEHAEKENYDNILVLEDDFMFHEDIKNNEDCKNISFFLQKKKNTNFQYSLGCVPHLQIPCSQNMKHYNILISTGTHSVIYSKKYREQILKLDKRQIKDWDYYNNVQYYFYRYTYYRPLCYQLFSDTENSDFWGYEHYFIRIFATILRMRLKSLDLDKQPEPGYSYMYMYSKLPFFVIIILLTVIILIVLVILFYLIYINKSISKRRRK